MPAVDANSCWALPLPPTGDRGLVGEAVADGRIHASVLRTGQPGVFLTSSPHKVVSTRSRKQNP